MSSTLYIINIFCRFLFKFRYFKCIHLSFSQDTLVFLFVKGEGLGSASRRSEGRPYVLNNPYPATHKAYLGA